MPQAPKLKLPFIPANVLLREPSRQMTERQSEFLALHFKAATAFRDFKRTGKLRVFGVVNAHVDDATSEELRALSASKDALAEGIKYYAEHGRLTAAYSDLRKVAALHWHPDINESWTENFAHCVSYTSVVIPSELALKIKKDLAKSRNDLMEFFRLSVELTNRNEKPN